MLDLFIISITIGVNLALAILISIKNGKPLANKIFVLFIFSIIIWCVTNYLADHSFNNEQALFWSKIVWVATPLGLFFALSFVFYFPFVEKSRLKIKIIISGLVSVLFAIFSLTDFFSLFIKEVYLGKEGIENIVYGHWFVLGFLYFVLVIFYIFSKFFIKYRKTTGFEKLQSKYFILGWIMFLFFAILFGLILPFITQNPLWSRFSPSFSIIFIGATTYAILRHRLMDIRLFIQKTILYALTFGFFLVIYLSLIFVFNKILDLIDLAPTIGSIISAVLVISLYPRFRLYFQKKTDSFFYRYPYDANRVLKEINEKCNSQIDFAVFFECFIAIIEKELKINKVLLVVLDRDEVEILIKNHNFNRKLVDCLKAVKCPSEIYEYFNHYKHPTVVHDKYSILEEMILKDADISMCSVFVKKAGVHLILPVYCKNQLVAFLFFGPKLSQEAYYPQDLQLFETLIDTLSLTFRNIFLYTDLKRSLFCLEEKVNNRTKELKELNENQSRFMADISHELQTPLAVLKGNLSLINQQKMTLLESQKAFLSMERSVDRLSHLIKDLVFLAKADVGKIEVNKENFSLSDLVWKVFEDSLILAEDKRIRLKAEIEKDILLFGDQEMIKSLLFNLISNAFKYAASGKEVKIKLFKEDETACLQVVDRGIGIAQENLPHIFSRFYRIENGYLEQGTGLGLAICKWIVQAHYGKIGVKSELNRGTTFKVILPLKI